MKHLALLLVFCIISCSPSAGIVAPVQHPFLSLNFDKVIAYDFDGGKGYKDGLFIVNEEGILSGSVKQEKELTTLQVTNLIKTLEGNTTYGSAGAACFDPHLGIVFYKDAKVVAHVSICLQRSRLASSVEIPAQNFHKINIGTEEEYSLEGLSTSGNLQLEALCQELRFGFCK